MNILQQSGLKDVNKRCVDCNTTKTPLWRGGPSGPRSLCNACGIRYRKKKRALLGLNRDSRIQKSGIDGSGMGKHEWRSKEEKAAFLLMALSCSSVYA